MPSEIHGAKNYYNYYDRGTGLALIKEQTSMSHISFADCNSPIRSQLLDNTISAKKHNDRAGGINECPELRELTENSESVLQSSSDLICPY